MIDYSLPSTCGSICNFSPFSLIRRRFQYPGRHRLSRLVNNFLLTCQLFKVDAINRSGTNHNCQFRTNREAPVEAKGKTSCSDNRRNCQAIESKPSSELLKKCFRLLALVILESMAFVYLYRPIVMKSCFLDFISVSARIRRKSHQVWICYVVLLRWALLADVVAFVNQSRKNKLNQRKRKEPHHYRREEIHPVLYVLSTTK